MTTANSLNENLTGFQSYDGVGNFLGRSIVISGGGASITNANGVAGDPTIALPTASQSSASRSLNTSFLINASRGCFASYSVDVSTSLSLTGGASGTIFFEISLSSTFASGIQQLASFTNANTGTLTIGLALNQTVTANFTRYVPAGYYVRLRTVNNTGTPTFTYQLGQETLL